MPFQLKQKIESLETKLEDSESEKKSLTQQLTDKQGQVRRKEGEEGTSGEGVNLAQNIYSGTSLLRSPTGLGEKKVTLTDSNTGTNVLFFS